MRASSLQRRDVADPFRTLRVFFLPNFVQATSIHPKAIKVAKYVLRN